MQSEIVSPKPDCEFTIQSAVPSDIYQLLTVAMHRFQRQIRDTAMSDGLHRQPIANVSSRSGDLH